MENNTMESLESIISKIERLENENVDNKMRLYDLKKETKTTTMIFGIISIMLLVFTIFTCIMQQSVEAQELEPSQYCYTNKEIEVYSNRDSLEKSGVFSEDLTLIKTYDDSEWSYVYYNDGQITGWIHSWDLNDGYGPISSDVWVKKLTSLGKLRCTGYAPSPSENGGSHLTSTGHRLTDVVGWCVAANPSFLRPYTNLYIDGIGYRQVLDCGVTGTTIDVLVNTNSQSYALTGYKNVYIVE